MGQLNETQVDSLAGVGEWLRVRILIRLTSDAGQSPSLSPAWKSRKDQKATEKTKGAHHLGYSDRPHTTRYTIQRGVLAERHQAYGKYRGRCLKII